MDPGISMLPCKYCNKNILLSEVPKHECFFGFDTVIVKNGKFTGAYVKNVTQANMWGDENCGDEGGNSTQNLDAEEFDDDTEHLLQIEEVSQESGYVGKIDPNELLIEEVKLREPLWNFTNKKLISQRTNTNKKNLWKEVYAAVAEYFENVDAVKRRWKNLTDTYKKVLKEVKPGGYSGAEGHPPKEIKWKYFKVLAFLTDSDLSYNDKTESSLDNDSLDNDSEMSEHTETQNESVPNPERIGQRQTKRRKSENALQRIADAMENPPMDAIKAFITFAEEKLRVYPQQVADRLMLKMHELLLSNVEG
ncbi:hypothetical protein QAD02_006734 [Eretmocerus hayati]|uniref:Uncharacterized protein n=1 Tax=Eretmocerus hayati TaxID=131215 RepID=A0ACC2N1R3_9HYME|nr:hypothetical protein QAD02_006734 [Eretmocerus hayati]